MAIRAPLEIPAEDGPDRDRALVQAHVGGDPGAFQQLVLGHYQSMLGHAYRRLHDGQAAEDAVQDALVRAYRSLSPAHEDYRLGPWLHRILDNVCTDEATRRHREYEAARRFQADLVVLRPLEDESPDLEYVTAAIAALPPGYRDALMLRDVMELEYADVAEQAGITEQNARARVSRARGALRRIIQSAEVKGSALVLVFRRMGRGAASSVRDIGASASSVSPDLVAAAPSKASMGMTSLAMMVAAAATVPGVTAIGSGGPTGLPAAVQAAGPSSSASASAGQGGVRIAAVTPESVLEAITSTTTAPTTSTTSTTQKSDAKVSTGKTSGPAASMESTSSNGAATAPATSAPPGHSGTLPSVPVTLSANFSFEGYRGSSLIFTGSATDQGSKSSPSQGSVVFTVGDQTSSGACGVPVWAQFTWPGAAPNATPIASLRGWMHTVSTSSQGILLTFAAQPDSGQGWVIGTFASDGGDNGSLLAGWSATPATPGCALPSASGPADMQSSPSSTTTTSTTSTTSTTTPTQ